jgi:hypothetical protein
MANSNKLKYACDERNINTGTTLQVLHAGITKITSVVISNLSTAYDMTVKLNASTNASRTIEAGKSLTISDEGIIDSIYISNASGETIAFSVLSVGS